ncbi:TonB-dependent receptor [Arenibacter sp. M-2]|uniref:SusC/RagA family TonB-linked outer membrane protein n=1 Tax=Arenibacter sp. M-2 TaxID=3053612 RepID=UPI00256FC09F|nr:TonB-dependent receptor [Arenibacter sp. M-2]MDL5513049.1 TonB-dependent receptor [Arenibacter sp. M-2]
MKTKPNGVPISLVFRPLITIMKIFIFLFSVISLGVNPEKSFSQNKIITFDSNGKYSIEEVFEIVKKQTDYTFIYKSDLFKNTPKIEVRKGRMKVGDLLGKCAILTNFDFSFTENGTIFLKEKPVRPETKIVQQPIRGTITDNDGVPLAGVNIIEKGTTNGTMSDFDGDYSINVSSSDAILVFSYLGYHTQEISVQEQGTINITLEESASTLEEVVVIGFGSKLKKDLTGSVSVVSSAELEKTAFASPQFALQGNTTGVRVINSSGDPNSQPEIYVRGIGSWQGNAQPLYVIDGQIITPPTASNLDLIGRSGNQPPPNLFTMINPDDIESISVLKDASSAAIYGSRGANGVVLITTKKGKLGGAKIEYSSHYGFQNIGRFDMLNTQQYKDLVQEMYANNRNPNITIENQLYGRDAANDVTRRISFSPQFDPESPYYISDNTTYDWQDDLVKRNAITESYSVKVSGANENTDYYLGIGYDNIESNLRGNELRTYRASFNINSKIKNWLKVGLNYKYAYQEQDTEEAGIGSIATAAPWQPLLDSTNEFGFAEVLDPPSDGWEPAKIYGQGSQRNVLAFADLNRSIFENSRQIGQGYVEVYPVEGLTLRTSLNLDYVSQDRNNTRTYRTNIFNPSGLDPKEDSPNAPNSLGSWGSRNNYFYNYQFDISAVYERSFGDHRFVLTTALQDQFQRSHNRDLSGDNIEDIRNLDRISYGNDLNNNSSFAGWNERDWFGYVGRLSYSFSDRYYLDGSFRRDASSGLAPDYRWGSFYSLSGAWRVSSESFMKNVSFINDLKLRGGYGEAGNDEAAVGKYAYLSGVNGGGGSVRLGSGDGNGLGTYYTAGSLNDFPNEALEWEVAETTYFGFDATLFDYKFNMTMEIYNRTQRGIQQTVNLPLSVGTNDPILNVGELENRGVDLQIGYNDNIGNFTYGVTANVSFLENEVTKLYNDQPLYSQNQFQRTYRVEKGRSLGHIWGYKVGGIFQTQSEIDAFYAATPDSGVQDVSFVAPGDLYFQDVQGDPTEEEPFYSSIPDGQINSNDQTEIGNTIPAYTYGLNLNAGYKGFDLSLNFYGEGDVDKYNYNRAVQEGMSGAGPNYNISVLDRWTPSNTTSTMPRAVVGDPAGNNRFSDRYVESAAFFRLNNWQLGYTVPGAFLRKLKDPVSSFRIYVSGQNNIYIYDWRGIDPTNDNFPLPKSFMMGLKVSF